MSRPQALSEFPHGENRGYNRGCRCAACRKARLDYWKAWQARAKADPPAKHGTPSRYRNYGCRCQRCLAAVMAYERDRLSGRNRVVMP